MSSSIQILKTTLQTADVDNVVVTAIEADADNGGYVREIRISCGGIAAEEVIVRLRAATSTPLEIDVPASQF